MNNQALFDSFLEFGSVYYEPIDLEEHHLACMQFFTHTKTMEQLFCFPCEVYIELISGLASIVIGTQPDPVDLKTFAIHHYLKINPGVCFNILPVSDEATYYLLAPENRYTKLTLREPYTFQLKPVRFNVLEILDYNYFTEERAYCFNRAGHEYFELIYVNSGTLSVSHADTRCTLAAGDLILYEPDGEHAKRLTKDSSCNYLSISFDMDYPDPQRLIGHVFHCTNGLRDAIHKIIEECPMHSPHAQTLMLCHLQEVITRLILLCNELDEERSLLSSNQNSQSDLLQQILAYMDEKVTEPITIEQICHKFFMSRTSLQALFKMYLHNSPKSYLLSIKLQKSKDLIRENQYTISEIADMLGFSSIHYFSRLFKKYFELSPSEYAKEIAASENS
ncbi:helix-turn-helix transcriptional regulator [Agathobaculum sp. Marseille-P7918]|uniref:helix-turn-helix transcriptional regulator n=1 Tax=Agathobaculum sp. Marseille-P7918 TaxID=2479843 RepID=UPI000F644CE5|nr:AraC family transcriptional regulator [Agathobaculum sp. Marseille-P7918]